MASVCLLVHISFYLTQLEMSSRPQAINSLVFFDLETTGFKDPDITELSFCSIDRSQFLNGQRGEVPRITNRLNLCIKPFKQIEPTASQITKLDNYNLDHQSQFDADVGNIVLSFLDRLKKPVCLVAHNGFKYDFPILMAEFSRLDIMEYPSDIFCVDSLAIFKNLSPSQTRLSFALKNVYNRIYGRDPEELHEAEADVKVLLLSAIATPKKFVDAVDKNAKPFDFVQKSW